MGELEQWVSTIAKVGLGGALLAAVQAFINRRKLRAEALREEESASKIGVDSDVALFDSYKDQLTLLLEQGRQLLTDNQELQRRFIAVQLENGELKAKTIEQARQIEILTQDTRFLRNQFAAMKQKRAEQDAEIEQKLDRLEHLTKTKQDTPETP